MECPLQKPETADLVLEYSARRLDAARSVMFEQHMEQCPACARLRVEQTAVWDALDAWEAPPVSADFNRRLWQRIDAAAHVPWHRNLAWIRGPAIPLAAIALALVVGLLLDRQDVKTPPAPAVIQNVSTTDADRLDRTLDDIQLLRQLDSAP